MGTKVVRDRNRGLKVISSVHGERDVQDRESQMQRGPWLQVVLLGSLD